MSEEFEVFKVVMLGEAGVGKTCIVNRYLKDQFTHQSSTIGSNFSSKIEVIDGQKIKL